jgi:hypothetical protein
MLVRVLIPFLAVAAWAQEQPAPPPSDAETALRARVEQFYQFQVDKKYRQAEAIVAEDTKDDYYNGRKPDIKGFTIGSVEMDKDNTKAKVVMKVKSLILIPGAGAQVMEMSPPTYWKIENGQWCWYIPAELRSATPFGSMRTGDNAARELDRKGQAPGGIEHPDVGALQGRITIDKTLVELSADAPDSVVTITNGLPGGVDLRLDPHAETIKGLGVKVDKIHLEQGEKTTVHLHLTGKEKIADVVEIAAFPLNVPLDITVRTK